ncbi:FprA family A-type flavoprotein [Nitrogeniibacter mangrovi]|uniref:FprA family A-type flavoprotein n=1 Tax=Nitrogeniibacter mangrovi TaxID=2016596 RepID=A0A6C1B6X4_9RHOO|nr:FprA family A-type flavoprotein [Nitrogeniibacter mangrovi]QID19516.1 FprA family A-type flavoprotein [Nitrogeniibacter mangrovi]
MRPAGLSDAAVELAPGVHWVGALDPHLRSFDIILKTANGTSYNSYVVRGETGVAVIDTVKENYADVFFRRLESVARYDEITTIVLNHLEPDHSGALPELLRRAPLAKVYLSTRAQMMLKALLKPPMSELPDYTPVTTGDEVDLGGRTLRFLHTPYLHWPDTQCTYLVEDGVLFSGDVFGCHFCDARLFNDLAGDFRFSFEYYYQHIMRPFREHVLDALALIEPLRLELIAPAHGPLLRHGPRDYVLRYRELATPRLCNEARREKTLVIFYLSAYGNTRRMAEAIAAGAERLAGVRVSLYDLEGGEADGFTDLVEEADGLAIGSPTINADAVKPVWDLLSSLTSVSIKGKLGVAFGSYGWSGEAVRLIEDRLRGLKLRVPVDGLRVKLVPDDHELDACRALGQDVARHLTGTVEHRAIDLSELVG